jgi:hypothetical protein
MLSLWWWLGQSRLVVGSAHEITYDVLGSLLVTPTGKSALMTMDNPYLPSSGPPQSF